MASMRCSTRRATNSAPTAAERGEEDQRDRKSAHHHRADTRAVAQVMPDQEAEAARQNIYFDQRLSASPGALGDRR